MLDQKVKPMLSFIPGPIRAPLTILMIAANTVFWFTLFLPFIALKLLFFFARPIRKLASQALDWLGSRWVDCNSGILYLTQKVNWQISLPESLDCEKSYLVVSNHQSWTDIFILQHVFKQKIPFLKFFLKKELIWVPVLGAAWWALDFPFMKRYSREYLAKHPEKRGQDMETTRKYCQRYRDYPVSVINFLEGSRFTPAKQAKQDSPYQHLLRPKAGGVALVLSVMGNYLDQVLDVTIVYPSNTKVTLWKLLNGQLTDIRVEVQARPLPANTHGQDYLENAEYREQVQDWVNTLWQDKDALLQELKPKGSELSTETGSRQA